MKRILKYSLLLLVGCSTPYQLPSQYQLAPKTTETVKNLHFSVGEQYLYRATITAYGHTFSGLLAAKSLLITLGELLSLLILAILFLISKRKRVG